MVVVASEKKDPEDSLFGSGDLGESDQFGFQQGLDIFILAIFQNLDRGLLGAIDGMDGLGQLRRVRLNESRCDIGDALIGSECPGQIVGCRYAKVMREARHDRDVRSRESID